MNFKQIYGRRSHYGWRYVGHIVSILLLLLAGWSFDGLAQAKDEAKAPGATGSETKSETEKLKPVFQSEEQTPAWVGKLTADEASRFVQIGKGSSVKDLVDAHQRALFVGATELVKRRFGDKVRMEVGLDATLIDDRMHLVPTAVVWLDGKPVKADGIDLDKVYYEIWETAGQKVYVVWVRIVWPREAYQRLVTDHTI